MDILYINLATPFISTCMKREGEKKRIINKPIISQPTEKPIKNLANRLLLSNDIDKALQNVRNLDILLIHASSFFFSLPFNRINE